MDTNIVNAEVIANEVKKAARSARHDLRKLIEVLEDAERRMDEGKLPGTGFDGSIADSEMARVTRSAQVLHTLSQMTMALAGEHAGIVQAGFHEGVEQGQSFEMRLAKAHAEREAKAAKYDGQQD